MSEAEENTTQSKPTEAEKPSWIRRNFFQTCVVLLLAWISLSLQMMVDSSGEAVRLDALTALDEIEKRLGKIQFELSGIKRNTYPIP